MKLALSKLGRILGIDFHVAITLLFRGWTVIAGAVMVFLVPYWFGKIEQGYYYTFGSIIALQVFFELGMNQVVVQFVGHEFAHLNEDANGVLHGPPVHIQKLSSLVKMLRQWYAIAALMFFVLVGCAGAIFFQAKGGLAYRDWLVPWLLLAGFSAVNLYLSPVLAFVEGCSNIGQVARLRVFQSVAGYSLMWVALTLGAGLWGTPIVAAVASLFTGFWINRFARVRNWLVRQPSVEGGASVKWRVDILPLQWRIAVSWISGYFIFQLFTPLVFANYGAIPAGQLGIALSVFTALLSVGMSWVSAKAPVFAQSIARGEGVKLNRLFTSVTIKSVLFVAAACAGFLLVVELLRLLDVGFVHRLADLNILVSLTVVTVSNALIFAAAVYMRAHKEEPMLAPSIASAIAIVMVLYFGMPYGVGIAMALYAGVTVFLTLPWTLWLLSGYLERNRRTAAPVQAL